MYTNINTEHDLAIIKIFLDEVDEEGKLSPDFNKCMIVEAAKLVMRWNLFEYGDCFLSN